MRGVCGGGRGVAGEQVRPVELAARHTWRPRSTALTAPPQHLRTSQRSRALAVPFTKVGIQPGASTAARRGADTCTSTNTSTNIGHL